MTDTTVKIEGPDGEVEESPVDPAAASEAHADKHADTASRAAFEAVESKAHSEHNADTARDAADNAGQHAEHAHAAAQVADQSVATIASLAEAVAGAVASIPDKIAEALASAQANASVGPDGAEESFSITPATPPKKPTFAQRYYGPLRKGRS